MSLSGPSRTIVVEPVRETVAPPEPAPQRDEPARTPEPVPPQQPAERP